MIEFTLISANDIHISDQGPRSRIDDFKVSMFGKISQARSACNKLKADAFLLTGDLYNLKNPVKNSHRLNQELINEFQQFKCPIYMIPGNHDLTANRIESLEEQPLGVLFADGTLTHLQHQIIEKEGIKISIVGIPYEENIDLTKLKIPDRENCISQICLMHIYAGPKSGMVFKERLYGYDEFLNLSPDIFIFGHYHIDQGIEEINGKHFINIGALSRGTLTDEDITHHPQIGIIKITVDNGKTTKIIQSIKLKVKPAEEIFDLKKREEERKESEEIQIFVDKLLSESGTAEKENKDVSDMVNGMDVTKSVKDRVFHFLQEASAKP